MIPKYLYQYTNIEALKKILLSRTILFNRLDLLNDPYEGMVMLDKEHKIDGLSRLLYCSCWTANPIESISMWGIYSDFRGVRIKAKSNLFSGSLDLQETDSGFVPVGNIMPIPLQRKGSVSGKSVQIKRVYGPIKIEYVVDINETYSNAVKNHRESKIKISEGNRAIKILELGNKKVDYWKYENEWRFKISGYTDVIGNLEAMGDACSRIEDKEFILVPFMYPIVEIMTAPCMAETEYRDIEKFLQDNNIQANLVKSSIQMQKI